MANEPPKPVEDDDVMQAFTTAMNVMQAESSLLAAMHEAGREPPRALVEVLAKLHTVTTDTWALAMGWTPREVLERTFSVAPEDEKFKAARAVLAERGRPLLDELG